MKTKNTLKKNAAIILIIALTGTSSLILSSFKSYMPNAELWGQLGIDQGQAEKSISNSFMSGFFEHYYARNIKNIATGNRVAVAEDLCTYAKTYVNSEQFKTAYAQYRDQKKPTAPKPMRTPEQVREEYLQSLRDGIKNVEESGKNITDPEVKKGVQESSDMLKQQLKESSEPGSPLIQMMVDGEKMTYENASKEYSTALAKWETDFPADPMQLVKKRLQKMLDVTKDVDYNAALVEKYHKKYFVNPAYEQKPTQWKDAFRAGKEVTTATRAFAQQWVAEIR
jgi:hypothetical protein